MAHFAELDENDIVLRVLVIADEDAADENGVESEAVGIAFCKRLFGDETRWLQTSYNSNMRGMYACVGYPYDPVNDVFTGPPEIHFTYDQPVEAPEENP